MTGLAVTVAVAVIVFDGSETEVAVIVAVPLVPGAVKRPTELIEPKFVDHVTAVLVAPVIVVVNVWVAPLERLTVGGVIEVNTTGCIVTVLLPLLLVSATAVALMVAVEGTPAPVGAV
jgi:hypothetical protein